MRTRLFARIAALLVAGSCWVGPAWADVLPDPARPKDWDEHPAPTPEVPLDDVLSLLALGMAGCTAAAAVKRARTLQSARRSS